MIIQYNETGEKHIGEGVLIEPMGLTLSSDENFLYVVDNGENLLYRFNLEHGSFIVYNPTEDGVLDIGELTDVVSSLDEVIYITDYTSNCLRILNANGHYRE
jgi:DNA-binding beta-propeller fold protein YncE